MSIRRIFLFLLVVTLLLATGISTKSNTSNGNLDQDIIVGRNVNLAPYPLMDPVTGDPLVDTGDPYLQRQNEPSAAVSTRNPMHLLAAANDYRTVYIPDDEQALPGIELAAQAPSGDAWLGIFKSFNGGQSWTTHLLPGYPQDYTDEGKASLLKGYEAACDPTVRAGSSGLFFSSGIVFDRIKNGGSAIFVARYIDNNNQAVGEMDSIEYVDVNIIDEGTSGQFADKPWIAVVAPSSEDDKVTIYAPSYEQDIPRFDVYIVYSVFLGSAQSGGGSKIMFAKSSDCGNTWGKPIKLSETVHICQGTNVVVSPKDGKIYVVWRQYARNQQGVPDAIVMCKSTNGGRRFTKAKVFYEINPYDQFTYPDRFRTSAFPAIAVDENGLVYVAWSDRGFREDGVPRIVIRTMDGNELSGPTQIDNYPGRGHQIMPSLAYVGGKILATWYDTRNSIPFNIRPEISGEEQTMDVRAAQADPSANPVFGDSIQVSRYLYSAETDENTGDLLDANGDSIHISLLPPAIKQAQSSQPNFPMFDGGNSPFMGDYIDSAPSPVILRDYETGTWRFNTGEEGKFDPTLCHIVFACNRDVVPPDDANWKEDYWPPEGPGGDCIDDQTAGMRNQNIYTAPVTQGIQVGCPVNTKPLSEERRSFLVFVKNLTDDEKLIRLTIDAPPGMDVSFWETLPHGSGGTPPPEECPFKYCDDEEVKLYVLPHSSITLTVFVQPYTDHLATLRVNVEEIIDVPDETTLIVPRSSIMLNPDPVNTQLIALDPRGVKEYDAPFLITEDLAQVDLGDATVFSDDVVFTEDLLAELLESSNPDLLTPTRRHPTRRHDTIINPTTRHSTLSTAPNGEVTDVSWSVKNIGKATAAYSFDLLGETPSVPYYQLLIYRVSSTTTSEDCNLSEEEHHELVLSYENPTTRHPTRRHESLRNPTRRHNTFFLAPGETAICTLRLIDPNPPQERGGSAQEAAIMSNGGTQEDFNPEDYATTIAGAAIPQAANEDGIIDFQSSLHIIPEVLPEGSLGDSYTATLEAYGGEPDTIDDKNTQDPSDDVWKYVKWRLKEGESLPNYLSLSKYGIISGTPVYDSAADYPQKYSFTVELEDGKELEEGVEQENGSTPTQFARRKFEIIIECNVNIIATATTGGDIYFEDAPVTNGVTVDCGDSPTFTFVPDDCFHIASVIVDGVLLSQEPPPTTYTFENINNMNQDHTIEAVFDRDTFTIKATAGVGGSIDPEDDVTVLCDLDQTFTITVDEGYMLEDVVLDKLTSPFHLGSVMTHTFEFVRADHTIEAIFKKLEKWDQRYDYADGADQANDIGVDPSGNVYVTGYSSNGTDNDYATINYLSDGTPNENWGTTGALRYDGGYGNDEASALDLDGSGNVYVTGFSFSRNKGEDFYTISYDNAGERSSARYDGPAHKGDRGNDIVVDTSGYFYVTGDSFRGMKFEHSDYATVKFDTFGEVIWDERYDARRNGHDVATAVALDSDGNVIITGRSEYSLRKNSDVLHYDYFTIKYRANNGGIAWIDRYDNADVENAGDDAAAIAVDLPGNVYVTGRSQGSGLDFDIVTIKYLSNGSRDNNWGTNGVVRFDGNYNDEAVAIAADSEGNVYVTGHSFNGTNNDYITIMYDSSGEEVWVRTYDNNGVDEAADIAIDTVGNIYVTGRSQDGGDFDYFTIKYDNLGNMVWRVRYDNTYGDDEARALVVDSFGNVYVTGRSKGMIGGVATGFDYATVKYEQ